VERVNAGGTAFVSHTRVAGRFALRVAIGNGATGEEHVRALWDALRRLESSV
jgi:aromatic-L-amino-acid decarboxylase